MLQSFIGFGITFMVSSQKEGVWGVFCGLRPQKTPHFPPFIEMLPFLVVSISLFRVLYSDRFNILDQVVSIIDPSRAGISQGTSTPENSLLYIHPLVV